MLRALALGLCLIGPSPAFAQPAPAPTFEQVRSEFATFAEVGGDARGFDLPGPDPRVPRGVSIWRPRNAGGRVLPVLYMADGASGLYSAATSLKPAIDAGRIPPIMIVGIDPDPQHRHEEYIPDWPNGAQLYAAHRAWFFDVVLPFAERRGASPDPAERVIGGFSNGADFALAMAAERPALFAGVLAQSPVGTRRFNLGPQARHLRWTLTAGRRDRGGAIVRLIDRIGAEIAEGRSPLRRCAGAWGHDMNAWKLLTPGSVAWLFGFDADIATDLERQACRTTSAPAPHRSGL